MRPSQRRPEADMSATRDLGTAQDTEAPAAYLSSGTNDQGVR